MVRGSKRWILIIGLFSDSSPAILYILVASIISSSFSGGRIDVILLQSMDLPEPGLPINIRLCFPAAAISKARLAILWPLTSEKSKGVISGVGRIWV